EPSYAPSFNLASTYYWRIDEANDAETPAIWQGDIWDFTTQEFVVVDDFESYNDIAAGEEGSNLVYDTWKDGFEIPTNGSTMGYNEPFQPTMESDTVHSGGQSAPMAYDNTAATMSEVTRTLGAEDWTGHGIQTLSLWFFGDPTNKPGQLYVKINGVQVNYDGEASNLTMSGWHPWNIDLTSVGTNLSSVTSLTIGVEGFGATGILLLDDIRLYAYSRELLTPVEPDPANLVAHWSLDEGAGITTTDGVGGKVANVINATWTAGLFSNSKSALEFDGLDDYVDVVGQDWGTFNQVSIAVWLKFDSLPGPYNSIFHEDWAAGGIHFMVRGSGVVGFSLNGRGPNDYNSQAVLEAGEIYHVVATFDIATGHTQIYINGVLDSEGTSSPTASAIFLRSPFTIGSWNTGRYWDGVLDDLRIYNHIVTDEEVAWLAGRTQPFDKGF
ncbi:MAG: LamG domain-containing protein, partial [Phycisphaerales bacterium]